MKKSLVAGVAVAQVAAAALAPSGAEPPSPRLGKSSLAEVVAAMTVEEKAKLLVGMGMSLGIPGLPALDPEDLKVPDKVPGAAGRTHALPRLGIPSLTLSDGPAGVRIDPKRSDDASRSYHATGFPVATLLASTWDVALMSQVGAAFGSEVRDYGIDILLAPGMNIHRNPLGGRNFEYYSEDPVVSGKMAAAFVRGVQSKGVGTSIKHLAANNQEFNRMQSNTIVGERALREVYLKGFEIAVKEGSPWTVMSSYNLVNGAYTSQSRDLLTTVLRQEWGFQGFVMSDWWAGSDVIAQMNAGNDLIMPGFLAQTQAIVAAAGNGTLGQRQLDQNVERVLSIVLRSPAFAGHPHSNQPDLKANAQVARVAAADGMVLLKNEGHTLPLAPSVKVALYGNASYDLFAGGTGSGDVHKAYVVSLDQGLSAAGYAVDAAQKEAYVRHIAEQKAKRPPTLWFLPVPPLPELLVEPSRVTEQASQSDVAIVTLGRNSGETSDRKVEDDFALSAAEQALIRTVADAFHGKGKKVVVVMNVGGVTEVASWRDRVDAILLAWQPGQEGGHAIADVLRGIVNPSGRLATTFPVNYEDVPSSRNFPGRELVGQPNLIDSPLAGKPAEVRYEEGLYVGYRYFETFGVKPAYEFGYGLSYADFAFGELKLSSARLDQQVTATSTITNTGKVPGRAVVQLYVHAPGRKLSKPANELKAFEKTGVLKPGQSQAVSFTIKPADLASYDPASASWIAEAGPHAVKIGASSLDIKQTAGLEVPQEVVVEKAHRALAPQVTLEEIEVRQRRQ